MESVAGNNLWMIPLTGLLDRQLSLVTGLQLITRSILQQVGAGLHTTLTSGPISQNLLTSHDTKSSIIFTRGSHRKASRSRL